MALFEPKNQESLQLVQLVALARSGDEDERREFLLQNPVFCSQSIVPDLLQIPELAASYGPLLTEFGINHSVRGAEIRSDTDDSRYPIGDGPIERICDRLESGELSQEQAFECADDPDFASRLSSIYVSALCAANLHVMRSRHDVALVRQLLVIRAVSSADPEVSLFNDEDVWKMRKWASAAFLEIASTHLCHVANSGVFHLALQTGSALAEESEERGELQFLGRILERLGVLHLDPYTALRNTSGYEKQIADWREQALQTFDAETVAFNRENPLPEPLDALDAAVSYLVRALQFQRDAARLGSLCALTQALVWRRALVGYWDADQTHAIAEEAMALASRSGDQRRIQQMTQLRDSIERLSAQQPPTFGSAMGRETTPKMSDADWVRKELWLKTLDELSQGASQIDPLGAGLVQTLQDLPQDDDPALLSSLTRLAFAFLLQQREELGIKVFEHPVLAGSKVPANLREPLKMLRAQLTLNAAVNLVRARRFGDALRLYQRSLDLFASLQLTTHVEDCLCRVIDLARIPEAFGDVLSSTVDLILSFERSMSTRQLSLLQKVLRAANAGIAKGDFMPEQVSRLWQLAKGYRFGMTLQRGLAELTNLNGPPWREVDAKLDAVDLGKSPERSMVDDHEFNLLMYAGCSRDVLNDETVKLPPSVVYDRALESALVEAALISRRLPNAQPSCATLDQLQARIGPDTVLLNYFLGSTADGTFAVYLMLLTDDACKCACIAAQEMPDYTLKLGNETGHPMAPFVAAIRNGVQEEPPEGRPASDHAMAKLRGASDILLAGFSAVLEDLRVGGKTHICVVPHGPLHFLPFHLIEVGGEPLASRWAVSYLPNLNLLKIDARRPKSSMPRSAGVATFAAASVAGYRSLPDAIDEAKAIAEAFGTSPRVDEHFDQNALVSMLLSGFRYVHIAGHGEMDIEAPGFHHLVLGSKGGEVEKFYAFQLQRMDLRGIELLTLSACETALGRFDVGDNLRGLPAFLFLSGASAIVGTLWKVETKTARTFFVELYAKLKEDGGRLNAFVHAQRETRKKHPEYRDWGAFCYLGDYAHPIVRPNVATDPGMSGIQFSNMSFTN